MSFGEILSSLMTTPGAVGAAFIDPQGQTVAQTGQPDVTEVLGAYQSVWLAELDRMADKADLGEISDVSLDFEGFHVLTVRVKAGYFLVIVFDATGVPSLARARLDEVRSSLAAEIE